MKYPINNIYACVQGEGCQTGVPMVMLRLQGCDVGCPWCDTKETWLLNPAYSRSEFDLNTEPTYSWQDSRAIGDHLRERFPSFKWVLISGGEPAQYDLSALTELLHDRGLRVSLETSGTEQIRGHFDWVTVSPKIDMPGGKQIEPGALTRADEIKMVIGKPADIARLDKLLEQNNLGATICLQPVSQSLKATQLCLETVQARGWRLSIQVHKYLNLP